MNARHACGLAEATDEELLARVAGGDMGGLGAIYARHAAWLRSRALRVLRNRSDADDVVSDTFLLLRERSARFTANRGTVVAWLTTMVRHLSIDRVRSLERRGRLQREVIAHEPAHPSEGPEGSAIDAAQRTVLRRAIARLPALLRQTIQEAYVDGLTYAQIATKNDVPIGTVKSRASRAMAALREDIMLGSAYAHGVRADRSTLSPRACPPARGERRSVGRP